MDTPDVYSDVLGDALSHSSQRLAQLGSLVTAAATMEIRRRAQANAESAARSQRELRALHEQQRAAWQVARAGWAAAHDSRWVAQADLVQAARVWGAAVVYADADPAAAAAVRKCEERLRVLHPYAMAWYDRLREEGAGAVEAMRQTVPVFGRAPHARPGDPGAERGALEASVRSDGASLLDSGAGGPRGPDRGLGLEQQVEERELQLVQRLQANALAERGYALSSDELATTLGAMTSLPSDVIAKLSRESSHDRGTAGPGRTRADTKSSGTSSHDGTEQFALAGQTESSAGSADARLSSDRTAAQLATESFPCTASDAVMAATSSGNQAGRSSTRTATPKVIRLSGHTQ